MSAPRNAHARAALLMLGSTLGFGLMAIFIRLASQSIPTWEVAFFRNSFGFLALLPMLLLPVLHQPRPAAAFAARVRTRHLPRYLVRTAIGIASMFCGFWAIAHLPLAQAISLAYSSPIFVTIGAVLVLGEVVRIRRWTAVLVGFIGVLVIVRPGADTFSSAALVALLAAALSASVAISIKFLSRTEKPDAIVLYTTLLWVPMSLVPAWFVWEWPSGIIWLWVVLSGLFGTAGHMLWTRALKLGDASMLTPISFLQVLVVSVYGYFLFNEVLDRWTMLGAGIIFASNVYIAHREAQLARRATTDPEIGGDAQNPR